MSGSNDENDNNAFTIVLHSCSGVSMVVHSTVRSLANLDLPDLSSETSTYTLEYHNSVTSLAKGILQKS